MTDENNDKAGLGLWIKVAGISFAAWSIMLPLGIWVINQTVADTMAHVDAHVLKEEAIERENQTVHADINRRLYTLEAEHNDVKRRLSQIEDRRKNQ